ncbi:hypothetical protein [Marinirhabdus gelatinilytica]|uniref:Uncharacterized protein n=1 Tax=Marinirhabdus gelatinilytica TaxID=1703343 RepID=A0A370QF67_9FLAO|nr:hypothetical protein [Marinirhabdus gelatinilytica]RDK87011.1 hypothetical protein C8D94_102189 [Marinirhabdus gelatinilytica]
MSDQDKKISLDTAKTWTAQWRSEESDYNSHNQCNAFLIPIQDLNGVLAEMGNPDDNSDACVRAYLGVDPTTNEEKLIIVGTEKDRSGVYRDLLPSNPSNAEGNVNSVWDFTKRCPPHCDDSSSLN